MTYKIIIALGLAGLLAACSQTDDSESSSTAPEKTVTEELKEKTEEVVEAAKEEAKELEEKAEEVVEAAKEEAKELEEWFMCEEGCV